MELVQELRGVYLISLPLYEMLAVLLAVRGSGPNISRNSLDSPLLKLSVFFVKVFCLLHFLKLQVDAVDAQDYKPVIILRFIFIEELEIPLDRDGFDISEYFHVVLIVNQIPRHVEITDLFVNQTSSGLLLAIVLA